MIANPFRRFAIRREMRLPLDMFNVAILLDYCIIFVLICTYYFKVGVMSCFIKATVQPNERRSVT